MFQILAESHSSTSIYLETKQNTHRKTILGETKNTRQKNYVYKQKNWEVHLFRHWYLRTFKQFFFW